VEQLFDTLLTHGPSDRHVCNIASLKFIRPCSPVTGYRLQVTKNYLRSSQPSLRNWGKRLVPLAAALAVVLDAELGFPGPDVTPDFAGFGCHG